MVVTDEMRRAVYEEDCARLGHILSYDKTMLFEPRGAGTVAGPDGQQAHIDCRRCGKVWLVVEEPGDGYEDATTKFRGRLRDDDPGKRPPERGAP